MRKPAKSIVHNWWRTRALGFHQKIQERRRSTPRFERKQEDHNWFCIELYIIFTLCVSARNVKQHGSTRILFLNQENYYKFQLQNSKS